MAESPDRIDHSRQLHRCQSRGLRVRSLAKGCQRLAQIRGGGRRLLHLGQKVGTVPQKAEELVVPPGVFAGATGKVALDDGFDVRIVRAGDRLIECPVERQKRLSKSWPSRLFSNLPR